MCDNRDQGHITSGIKPSSGHRPSSLPRFACTHGPRPGGGKGAAWQYTCWMMNKTVKMTMATRRWHEPALGPRGSRSPDKTMFNLDAANQNENLRRPQASPATYRRYIQRVQETGISLIVLFVRLPQGIHAFPTGIPRLRSASGVEDGLLQPSPQASFVELSPARVVHTGIVDESRVVRCRRRWGLQSCALRTRLLVF